MRAWMIWPGSGGGSGGGKGAAARLGALGLAVLAAGCGEPEGSDEPRALTVQVTNLTPSESVYATGTFDTPDTALAPSSLAPGESYRIDVTVHPGAQVQLITMLLDSNDAFLAFPPGGIALWTHDGQPLAGDRTDDLVLYDAGTEVNEALGSGPHQAARQSEPGEGTPQGGVVRVLADDKGPATDPDALEFPAIAEFVAVHVVHRGGPEFQIVITNVSPPDLIGEAEQGMPFGGRPVVLSPGVFTVHGAEVEWFGVGEPVTPQVERLVEDGDPGPLALQLERLQGVASDLSPVVWAVHDGGLDLCGLGAPASRGVEDLAENGRTELLAAELQRRATQDPDRISAWGVAERDGGGVVIEPGERATLRLTARPGDRLSLLSSYLAANDKLVGACEAGIALFDEDGQPRTGELNWAIDLVDAGTELDEPPGLGANQFERQARSDAGIDEHQVVREVRGEWLGWSYPVPERIVSVAVEAVGPAESAGAGAMEGVDVD